MVYILKKKKKNSHKKIPPLCHYQSVFMLFDLESTHAPPSLLSLNNFMWK